LKRTTLVGCLLGVLASTVSTGVDLSLAADTFVPCSDPLGGCPDLITDPTTMAPNVQNKNIKPNDCQVVEGMTQAGNRKLLRFTFTTPNIGEGDLIVGRPEDHPEWFEWSDCHGHYHFKEYADYRLWTPSQKASYESYRVAHPEMTAAEVMTANPGFTPIKGEKAGFCIIDVLPYSLPSVPKYVICDFQGISVGWSDEYHESLDGQFVDVTGVPSGSYVLEAEVNSERLYQESDYTNNRAYANVTI